MNLKMYKPKYKSLCPKCEELLSQFVEHYMPAISKNNEFELAIVKKDEVEMWVSSEVTFGNIKERIKNESKIFTRYINRRWKI